MLVVAAGLAMWSRARVSKKALGNCGQQSKSVLFSTGEVMRMPRRRKPQRKVVGLVFYTEWFSSSFHLASTQVADFVEPPSGGRFSGSGICQSRRRSRGTIGQVSPAPPPTQAMRKTDIFDVGNISTRTRGVSGHVVAASAHGASTASGSTTHSRRRRRRRGGRVRPARHARTPRPSGCDRNHSDAEGKDKSPCTGAPGGVRRRCNNLPSRTQRQPTTASSAPTGGAIR